MSNPDTKIAPATQPDTRSVPKNEFVTIMIAVVGIGVTLGGLLLNAAFRIETRLDNIETRIDTASAQAAADRRAADARMDEFRRHMQRLGERQARLEGQREGITRQ